MFSANTYKERRKALIEKVGSGTILLVGNDESSINFKDNWYHYRQDSTFLYFFGINLPGLAATINCETGESTIFGDELTMEHIVWSGPQPTIAELAEKCGAEKTLPLANLQFALGNNVHYLPTYRAENKLKLSKWLAVQHTEVEAGTSVKLIKAIIELRSIKSAEEIAELHKACTITSEMHLAAMQYTRPGLVESEVVGKIHDLAIAGGGNLAFPVIFSKNGQTLHNHYYGNVLSEGDLVICDAGGETSMGYAGDMTRSYPAGTKFTQKQKEVYQIVLDGQMAAIEALKPGVPYRDVHLKTCRVIASGLKDLGIMTGNVDEAVEAGAHALFMPHGLGHMMGLDVHDLENLGEDYVGYDEKYKRSTTFGLNALRLGKELQQGHVLTVEPGTYFIPELINIWKQENKHEQFINYNKLDGYRDFGGIRIEEDFVITKSGSELLGKPLAKTIEEVEEVRAMHLETVNG